MNASAPPLDPSIAFALLAAGRSQRFGGGKLEAVLNGKPLWRWAADTAEVAGFATRFLIVPAPPKPETAAEGWTIAVNANADAGIATSISLACSLATDCRRVVIGLADMPFVEPDHLRVLAMAEGVAFTRYPSCREGVPASFPREAFARLANLQGDRGAATIDWAADRAAIAPTSPASLIDIDTPQDLERARAQLMARRHRER